MADCIFNDKNNNSSSSCALCLFKALVHPPFYSRLSIYRMFSLGYTVYAINEAYRIDWFDFDCLE